MCVPGVHRYRDDDSDRMVACGETKSPGVFVPGGLQRFVDAAVVLGDPSDPDFKEWLDKRLRPQTDFDSKVRTPGRRAAPCKCICRSDLLLAWPACDFFTSLAMLLYAPHVQLGCRWQSP